MKAADLYRLMESPALLTEDTLQQLKQIVDEFPYFQIARMLYLNTFWRRIEEDGNLCP